MLGTIENKKRTKTRRYSRDLFEELDLDRNRLNEYLKGRLFAYDGTY